MPRSNRGSISASNLNPVKVSQDVYDTYDYDSFTVATATTDYDAKANETLFRNVPIGRGVIIWSDQDISIKFNSTSMPAISHEAVFSPHQWFDKLEIMNIYITNTSGNTANIRIFLV